MKTLLEETNHMRRLMGLPLIVEQSVSFPKIVTNTYNGQGDCDRLHTFSTRKENGVSTEVGGMNTKVGDELKRIYNLGYNPEVTQVDVEVDDQVVTWTAYINESKDGKAWIGITSRGAGCNNDIENRATSSAVGNDVGTLRKMIIKGGYNIDNKFDLEKVNDYVYNGGEDSFKQVFYRYTRPTDYPPHSTSTVTKNKKPIEKDSNKTNTISITHNNDPLELRGGEDTYTDGLKDMGIIYNPVITTTSDGVTVSYDTSGDKKKLISYIFSPICKKGETEDCGDEDILLTKVKNSNSVSQEIPYDIGDFKGYIIVLEDDGSVYWKNKN